ncbi:hypothetical protein Ddye_003260 [Dipteronia dyeriana]|uniref:SEA domain-containing protein n=1 Tax=Dipteronia dyeriana TaxID=168575 RepID=A0AAD9XSK1_9ROSI|nr:hypothetical protein Ddye_003260 [Dipteronia dyeriana]
MGQYNLWKLDPETADTVSCIWIFHRPYRYNPYTKLLWTSNASYEWYTTYDYEKSYPHNLQISLLNFFCDVNGDTTDMLFILPRIPRDPTQSWHPFQDSYQLDSHDPISLARKINFLVQHRFHSVKEYIQSTALTNCLVSATVAEQYVDLQIDQQMIDQWIREGYSHPQIGAVRIILTLYGMKVLPVTVEIVLLNTIYKQYEHAVIGTCLSTLHADVLLDGSLKQPSQAEQVLKWQSHNARVQNRVLNSIDQKIDRVTHHVSQHDHHLQSLNAVLRDMFSDLQSIIVKLDTDLHRYINHGYFGSEFDRKEREIRQLREQLKQMNREHLNTTHSSYIPKPYPYTQSLIFPTQSPQYSPSTRPPDSSQYFKSTGELF